MIHQTIAKLGQEIHFRGQNEHWSILTGALVANYYIVGHLRTFFTCCMSIYRYSLMYLMIPLFWLRPNLANKYSKIFSFIARARGQWSLLGGICLAQMCVKRGRKNFQVQLMKLTLIYCHKSRICSQKARARTFALIPSKPKNACNIHNFECACKKTASWDYSELCWNTV